MKFSIQSSSFSTLFFASAALLSGCGKDDDHNHPGNDQELITTLRLNLTHTTDSIKNVSIIFHDLDGEGGQDGIILPDTLRLILNTQYSASLEVLDESGANKVEDIAEEIREESASHQFFYTPSQGLGLTVANYDQDSNHMPLGLEADVLTSQQGKGTLRISLNHYDSVTKNGTTPSGETDIEVVFPVSIE